MKHVCFLTLSKAKLMKNANPILVIYRKLKDKEDWILNNTLYFEKQEHYPE